MKYIVDIDNTICNTTNSDYHASTPIPSRIEIINNLFESDHEIIYWTARGGNSGIDWTGLTKQQLGDWGCKYNELRMFKPSYDVWVDDKATWIFGK